MIDETTVEVRREFAVSWSVRSEVTAEGAAHTGWAEFSHTAVDRDTALELHAALLTVQAALGTWAMRVQVVRSRWPQLDATPWENVHEEVAP